MNTSKVVQLIGEQAKLNTKEKRLLAYIYDGGDLIIGATCKALNTTPFTLLGKTLPSLKGKLKQVGINLQ